ncbi:MAG: hypothetical protein ACOYMF_05360 [Bacteroidales bacterium]
MKKLLILICLLPLMLQGQDLIYGNQYYFPNQDAWYGVEWNVTDAGSAVTRIGRMDYHVTLPVQSLMRRVLLLDDGSVNYALRSDNSYFKESGDSAKLDGTDGQVMVEKPLFYFRWEESGNVVRLKVSLYPLSGFTLSPKQYIGAFKAALNRTGGNKLSSVVNLTTAYRGGGNQSAWDALPKTQLGKPATDISLTNFRTYARNRGSQRWNAYSYVLMNQINMLYLVEYANRNCQLAVNSSLTSAGYKQGGLGDGVTTVSSGNWSTFNGYYPLIPCGKSLSLGNLSGEVSYTINDFPTSGLSQIVKIPSYRGVENQFGDLWEWIDGILFRVDVAGVYQSKSRAFICDNPVNYASDTTINYRFVGYIPRTDGFTTTVIGGYDGLMLPSAVDGASTTYWSDYNYQYLVGTGTMTRGFLGSGRAGDGAGAGLWDASSNNGPSDAFAAVGSRLCFL